MLLDFFLKMAKFLIIPSSFKNEPPTNREIPYDPNHLIFDTSFTSTDNINIKTIIYKTRHKGTNENTFIFFSHGNYCYRKNFMSLIIKNKLFDDINICMWDYRGTWGNEGSFTKEKTNHDFDNALHFLKNNYQMKKCILVGHSLGSGVTTEYIKYIDKEKKEVLFDNIALISPFSSVLHVAYSYSFFRLMYLYYNLRKSIDKLYAYDNLSNLSFVKCKILLVHGINDDIVPFDNSLELEKEMKKRNINYEFIKRKMTKHNDIPDKIDVWEKIKKFI